MNLVVKNAKGPITKFKVPWAQNQVMESIGFVAMIILIGVSNAGGLSGAGSNIPIILLCYGFTMPQAVPLSATVAVTATVFRFIFMFNEVHPCNENRNIINYEMVNVSIPFVFLGGFIGILIGKLIGGTWQVIVFECTVAWSIYTTCGKYQ